MTVPTDLVSRWRAGDSGAGPLVGQALLPVARTLALAGTLDPAGAEEVTRAALARILPRLAEADAATHPAAVAEETTREEVRAWVKAHGGRTTEIVGLPAEAAAKARGPAVRLAEIFGELPPDRAALMLLEAVNWIPEQYQSIFLLRNLEGLDYAEIADLTGHSPREVAQSLSAARKLFERELTFQLRKLATP